MTRGIAFPTADHVVGSLVARCEREGKHTLAQLPTAAFNEATGDKSDVRVTDNVYACLAAVDVVNWFQSASAAGGRRPPISGFGRANRSRLLGGLIAGVTGSDTRTPSGTAAFAPCDRESAGCDVPRRDSERQPAGGQRGAGRDVRGGAGPDDHRKMRLSIGEVADFAAGATETSQLIMPVIRTAAAAVLSGATNLGIVTVVVTAATAF